MAWTSADLAESTRFVDRVKQLAIKTAISVQNEATTAAFHAQRGAFAQKVLADPDTWAPLIARAVAENATVLAGTPDAPAGDVEFAIAERWDAFSVVKV